MEPQVPARWAKLVGSSIIEQRNVKWIAEAATVAAPCVIENIVSRT